MGEDVRKGAIEFAKTLIQQDFLLEYGLHALGPKACLSQARLAQRATETVSSTTSSVPLANSHPTERIDTMSSETPATAETPRAAKRF